jgi:hypothetical protein
MKGQINLGTTAGDMIFQIAKRSDINSIVEIGTWNGLGSTMCVIEAIKESKNKNFTSLELYPEMYELAKQNLGSNLQFVNLLNGRIIEYDEVFWFDHSIINFDDDGHARLYYNTDLEHLKSANNVLDKFPEKIDFLILDGGEYTTFPEWQKLKSRTKIVALDDSNILKTSKIREQLINDDEYIKIFDDLTYRNGFTVFEKK